MGESLKTVCPSHGDVKVVHSSKYNALTHIMLSCGCTLEEFDDDYVSAGDAVLYKGDLWRVDESVDKMVSLSNIDGYAVVPLEDVKYVAKDTLSGTKKSEIKVSVGAIVRHKTLRLTGSVDCRHSNGLDWSVRVARNAGETDLKYVWRESELEVLRPGYNISSERTSWRQTEVPHRRRISVALEPISEPKKAQKSHSISTADFIKEEVRDLRKAEQDPVKITKTKDAQKTSNLDSFEKVKTKKRKGSW